MNQMLRNGFACFFLLSVLTFAQQQNCELLFQNCPENLNSDTITVPSNIIAISTKINACDLMEIIEEMVDTSSPPSIVFVIDHSHSMTGLGYQYPGNDPDGARFTVTKDLIDTVYSKYPNAEVGLVVFREVLYFDHRNNNLLEHLSTYSGNQSYLPLLTLNQKLAGGVLGVQAVKNLLVTRRVSGRNSRYNVNVTYTDLVYEPGFNTVGNTNINVAFDAARAALASASNPPERQFVIFLSDGEPFPVDNWSAHGNKDPFDFKNGTGLPTTYTVYLHDSLTEVPASIAEMTQNIRTNGYSTTNQLSNTWLLHGTDYNSLMSLLMNKIVRPLLSLISGTPNRMTFNRVVSTVVDDSGFAFNKRFPLLAGITPLDIDITYRVSNMKTGTTYDTVTQSTLYVRREDNAVLPEGFGSNCWDKPQLSVQFEGSPINVVRENMDRLEVVLNSGSEVFKAAQVTVSNADGQKLDLETLPLTGGTAGEWSGAFFREILASPKLGDKRLQHRLVDSIIVVFRNPDLPLDTIRVALPFSVSKSIQVQSASYHDKNADGFIDSIYIATDNVVAVEDLEYFVSQLNLPYYRGFKAQSVKAVPGGVAILVKETGSPDPRTSTNSQDQIEVLEAVLPNGGIILGATIPVIDKVAPVILSAYLRIDGSTIDSLVINFSEPVLPVSGEQPFLFRRDSVQFAVLVGEGRGSDVKFTFPVHSVQDDRQIAPGDSVWINFASDVADAKNNLQRNPANRRVSISVRQLPYEVQAKAVNNPFNPATSLVPEAIRRLGVSETNGLVIMVEPQNQLRNHIRLQGTASVYDVVKNPIVQDIPLVYDEVRKRLFFVWNGRNSSGRLVSTGTYQAILTIKDNQDFKDTKYVRIGVKR